MYSPDFIRISQAYIEAGLKNLHYRGLRPVPTRDLTQEIAQIYTQGERMIPWNYFWPGLRRMVRSGEVESIWDGDRTPKGRKRFKYQLPDTPDRR